jgi:hypothetical protein
MIVRDTARPEPVKRRRRFQLVEPRVPALTRAIKAS